MLKLKTITNNSYNNNNNNNYKINSNYFVNWSMISIKL